MFFWLIEGLIPIVEFNYSKWKHALPNLFLTLTTAIINLGFAFAIIASSDWATSTGFGILQWVTLPLWLQLILGLMLMDLIGAYTVHWVEHKVHWMWKFHVIHHSDTHIDTTSALRHHPGESVFRAFFTVLAVLIIGAPIWLLFLYQSVSALMSQFNHANLKLPKGVDKVLSLAFCTPDMHRVHHHIKQPLTDMNYGNIFCFWDKIFDTYARVPVSEIEFGLDVFNKREGHLGDLLKLPFDGERYTRDKKAKI